MAGPSLWYFYYSTKVNNHPAIFQFKSTNKIHTYPYSILSMSVPVVCTFFINYIFIKNIPWLFILLSNFILFPSLAKYVNHMRWKGQHSTHETTKIQVHKGTGGLCCFICASIHQTPGVMECPHVQLTTRTKLDPGTLKQVAIVAILQGKHVTKCSIYGG